MAHDPNSADSYFPDEAPDEAQKLYIEIPAEPPPFHPERISNGYDPMGEIRLRGQASRGLAAGSIPWWVLVSSWIMFAVSALWVLYLIASSQSLGSLVLIIFLLIPLLILWRGTTAKLARRQRRSKYQSKG